MAMAQNSKSTTMGNICTTMTTNTLLKSKVMSSSLVVLHGGKWKKNAYEGGIKHYIPIPPGGIKYEELLTKLKVRLVNDKSKCSFDIDALVANGEMRMKISNEFEWSCLLELMEFPTIYVNVVNNSNSYLDNIVYDSLESLTLPAIQNENSSGSTSKEQGSCSQWVIPGASHQAAIECDHITLIPDPVGGEFACGSTFCSKDDMTEAVGIYHLKNCLECRIKRSDSKRYHAVCKYGERCSFTMQCRSFGKEWRICEWIAHNCERDLRRESHPKISSKALAAHVAPNFSEDRNVLRPRDIQGQILRDFGVNLKYSTALASRNRALNLNYGDQDKSFQMLPKYLYMLELLNPGSIVDLQTCEDGSFQYCFFSLAACIRAFRACRPVIVIDATHLKGKYKGVLFVASTKDANEQIVPLSFLVLVIRKTTQLGLGFFSMLDKVLDAQTIC